MPEGSSLALKPLESVSISLGPSTKHLREQKFARSVHHIERLFQFYLCEQNSCILDGVIRLTIFIGPHAGLPGFHRETNFSTIDTSDFSLDDYFAKEGLQRDIFLVDTVESALLGLAERFQADPSPIQLATKLIREGDYAGFIPCHCEPAAHPKVELEARTFYCYSRTHFGSACVQLQDIQGHVVETGWVPDPIAHRNPFFNYFKSCRWEGDDFHFCTENGDSIYAIPFQIQVANAKRRPSELLEGTSPLEKKRDPDETRAEKNPSLAQTLADAGTAWQQQSGDSAEELKVWSLEEIMEDARGSAMAFLEAILKGESGAAYSSLSQRCRDRMKKSEFLERIAAYNRFASPKHFPGNSLKKLRPLLFAQVAESGIVLEYAESIKDHSSPKRVLAAVTIGCESLLPSTLTLFVVEPDDENLLFAFELA